MRSSVPDDFTWPGGTDSRGAFPAARPDPSHFTPSFAARLISHAWQLMLMFAMAHLPPSNSGTRKQIVHLLRRCEPKAFAQSEHFPSVAASFSASSSAVIWPCAPDRRARELVPAARRRSTVNSSQAAPILLALSSASFAFMAYLLCVTQRCDSILNWEPLTHLGHQVE